MSAGGVQRLGLPAIITPQQRTPFLFFTPLAAASAFGFNPARFVALFLVTPLLLGGGGGRDGGGTHLLADACMPVEEASLTQTVHMPSVHVVAYGRALYQTPDERFDYGGGSDVYTATVKIFCSLKGADVAPKINVTQVGMVPGHCKMTELISGKEYIVMLSRNYHRGSAIYKIQREAEATAENINSITQACGLQITYPSGVDGSTSVKQCPEPASDDTCIPDEYLPMTTRSSVTTKTSQSESKNGETTNGSSPEAVIAAGSGSRLESSSFILSSLIFSIFFFVQHM